MADDLRRVQQQAAAFRGEVAELLEPGGLTAQNLAAVAAWLSGPAWTLVAEQRRLLWAVAADPWSAGDGS